MHAWFGPVHEQRLAPYGAMILPGLPGVVNQDELVERLEEGFDCEIHWLNEFHAPVNLDPHAVQQLRLVRSDPHCSVVGADQLYGRLEIDTQAS